MKNTVRIPLQVLMILILALTSCKDKQAEKTGDIETQETASLPNFDPADEILGLSEQWTGDPEGMIEIGRIRVPAPWIVTRQSPGIAHFL